jgi:hypothetical protein
MEKFLKKFRIKPYKFFFLIGLVTLVWFRGGYVLDTLDLAFPYNIDYYFSRIFNSWNNSNSFGYIDNRFISNLFPYAIYLKILSIFQIPLWLIEWSVIYLCFSISGLSMYYFTKSIGGERRACYLAGLFYMVNPFSLTFIWSMRNTFFIFYAFIPLLLGMYLNLLSHNFKFNKILIFTLLTVFLLSSSFSNPAFFGLFILLVASITIFMFWKYRSKQYIKTFTLSIFLVSIFSMFWILPIASSLGETARNASTVIDTNSVDDIQILQRSSKSALDSFKLVGFWALEGSYKGQQYFPWYVAWQNQFVQTMLLLPMIFTIIFLIASKNKYKIYLIGLVLVSIFFLAGTVSISSGLKLLLFSELKFLSTIFRSLETKFGPLLVLGLAPAVGIGVAICMRSKLLRLPIAILVLVYASIVWRPVVNGTVARSDGAVYPASAVKIPEEYSSARKWLNENNGDSKILSVPLNTTSQSAYNWGQPFVGTDPTRYILSPGVLTNNIGEGYIVPRSASVLFNSLGSNINDLKLLGQNNIGTILIHNDTDWNFVKDNKLWTFSEKKEIESLSRSLKDKSTSFGALELIKTPAEFMNQKYFISHSSTYAFGDLENIYDINTADEKFDKESVILTNNLEVNNLSPSDRIMGVVWGNKQSISEPIKLDSKAPLLIKDVQELASITSRKVDNLLEVIVYRMSPEMTLGGEVIQKKVLGFQKFTIPIEATANPYLKVGNEMVRLNASGIPTLVTEISLKNSTAIEVFDRKTSNLVANGNFENGYWLENVIDCSQQQEGEANINQEILNDNNNNYLRLYSSNHSACTSSKIDRPINLDLFSIRMNYKSEGDSPAKYCVWEGEVEKCIVLEKLERATDWESTASTFVANSYDTRLDLYLYADAKNDNLVSNYYDEIEVYGYNKIGDINIGLKPNNNFIQIGEVLTIDNAHVSGSVEGIENGNFEDGKLWHESVGNCSRLRSGDPQIGMELIDDALLLKSNNHLACTNTKINEYLPGYSYILNLKYKNLSGANPSFCIWEVNLNKCIVKSVISSTEVDDNGWRSFNFAFNSSNDAQNARLYLYTEATGSQSVNLFDEISVQRVPLSLGSLVYVHKQPSSTPISTGGVASYKEVSTNNTELSIKNATRSFMLVFLETFHTGWKASLKGDGEVLSNHVKVNGFANGWKLNVDELCKDSISCKRNDDGSFDFEIIVQFTPQNWVATGSTISGISALAALFYLGISYRIYAFQFIKKMRDRRLVESKYTKNNNHRNFNTITAIIKHRAGTQEKAVQPKYHIVRPRKPPAGLVQ